MITNNTYEQLPLNVLGTFELSLGTVAFHWADFILFQAFGAMNRMSLTNFFV